MSTPSKPSKPSDRPAPRVRAARGETVVAEIVAVGRGLLAGRVEATNATDLARFLTQAGVAVARVTVTPPETAPIAEAIRGGFERGATLVVTSGGLGPAHEDCTLAAVSDALSLPLAVDREAKRLVEAGYAVLKKRRLLHSAALTAAREKMARIPVGSAPVENPEGIAPGVFYRMAGGGMLLCLPGRPAEMHAVLERAAPDLRLSRRAVARREIEAPTTDEALLRPLLDRMRDEHPDLWVTSEPAERPGKPATIAIEAAAEDAARAESAAETALKRLLAIASGSP